MASEVALRNVIKLYSNVNTFLSYQCKLDGSENDEKVILIDLKCSFGPFLLSKLYYQHKR